MGAVPPSLPVSRYPDSSLGAYRRERTEVNRDIEAIGSRDTLTAIVVALAMLTGLIVIALCL